MATAGLLVGLLGWAWLETAYPFYRLPKPDSGTGQSAAGPISQEEAQRLGAERDRLTLKNTVAAGAALGALAGLVFSIVESLAGARRWTSLGLIAITVVIAAGLGALAGHAATELLAAWRTNRSIEPMQRTLAVQGTFWVLLSVGVGLGVGLFAKRFSWVLGTVLQAALSGVLFVIAYVAVAGVLFPIDDAERIVPASLGNRALWSIAALTILGLALGLARQRSKTSGAAVTPVN